MKRNTLRERSQARDKVKAPLRAIVRRAGCRCTARCLGLFAGDGFSKVEQLLPALTGLAELTLSSLHFELVPVHIGTPLSKLSIPRSCQNPRSDVGY